MNRGHTPPPPIGLHAALLRNTGYLISRLGLFASKRFGERLESMGLTTRMWGALNVIVNEQPITQQQLGKAIGMDPSSMVGAIDALESHGFVERRPHPSDRRAHALYLTDQGNEALRKGRELAKEAQNELLAPLDADERKQLHDLLLRLALATETVGEITKPPGPS